MDRNIIIILVSAIILPWCIYVHKARKSLSGGTIAAGYAIMALWVIMVGLPNIPVLIAPFSPPIHGRVVDVTNQPVANCNIKAYWEIETIGLAGGHWESYQQFITKTNTHGDFHIPRRLKALSLYGLLPALEIASHYNGIKILAYAHGYSYSFDKIDREKQRGAWQPLDMSIRMYKPSDTYLRDKILSLKSEFKSWNVPRGEITDEDKEFLLEDYRYNYGLFITTIKGEKSKENKSALIVYASSLSRFGDNRSAIGILLKLKNDYPDSSKFADQEIEELKRSVK